MSSSTANNDSNDPVVMFDKRRHLGYFASSLRHLPAPYCKLDTNRLTMVHFCVHALDLLSNIWADDNAEAEELRRSFGLNKDAIIDWIYSLQTTTTSTTATSSSTTTFAADPSSFGGFKGGSFLGAVPPVNYNHGHIAMTYTALCTLKTLGDDWSRLDRPGIIQALQSLQLPDGSFQCIAVGSEHDMRFLYCACCISHMLQDWTAVDRTKAVAYIKSCRSWDGAIALIPGGEGHGGSTFCGVASLLLMNQLDAVMDADWKNELIYWCVHRQMGGMQGRPNKDEDTCYSYWIGGTLRLLQEDGLLQHDHLRQFVMNCQTNMGGFGKVIGAYPDVLHSYYSMSYLSFSQPHLPTADHGVELKKINCTLGFGQEHAAQFEPLHP